MDPGTHPLCEMGPKSIAEAVRSRFSLLLCLDGWVYLNGLVGASEAKAREEESQMVWRKLERISGGFILHGDSMSIP